MRRLCSSLLLRQLPFCYGKGAQQNGSQLCVTSYVLRRAGVCPHGKILLIIFPLL